MERFNNPGQGECVVVSRKRTNALIRLLDNECTPFCVPLEHKRGESEWWQGRYFKTFEKAYRCWEGEVV